MENKALHEMSMNLLMTERLWRTLLSDKPKEHPLPDVGAAEERMAKARKNKIIALALAIVMVLAYLFINPRLKAYKEAAAAQGGFVLSPTALSLLFWFVMFLLFVVTFWVFSGGLVNAKDKSAAETYAKNKQLNEQEARSYAESMEKVKDSHKTQVERINQEAGTKLGDASPRYFFQIPFDPEQGYRSLKAGKEFYSEAFMDSQLVEAFGRTSLGTSPVIHKPRQRYLRFDGFYGPKKCRISEVLPLLEKGGYTALFQDRDYLREHPEEEVWLQCIWDTESIPVENQGFFKFKDMELAECLESMTGGWTEIERFMASGIPEYEPYVQGQGSLAKDQRSECYHKEVSPKMYTDVVDIMDGDGPFRLVKAKKASILEKGYLICRDSDRQILYAALTDHPVYTRRIDFNCSIYEWEKHPRFHGWIAAAGAVGKREMPDKASTINFICNELHMNMPDFDAAAERPQGFTDELYRFWIYKWYLAGCWKKDKQQAQSK